MHFLVLAQEAPVLDPSAPFWQQVVYAVILTLVTMFLVPYLKRQAEKARAEAEQANQTAKGSLLLRVKQMALDEASVIAQQRFPVLAKMILDAKAKGVAVGMDQVKDELKSWGLTLKNRLVEFFARDGTDLSVAVGDAALDSIVRWAADRVSPFPGKDTAVTVLIDDWTNKLAKFGVDWVREKWLKQDEPVTPTK